MKEAPPQSPEVPSSPDEPQPDVHSGASTAGAVTGALVGGLVGALGGPVGLIMGATAGTIVGGNAALSTAEDHEDRVAAGEARDATSPVGQVHNTVPVSPEEGSLSPPRDSYNQGGFSSEGQQQVLSADNPRNNRQKPGSGY